MASLVAQFNTSIRSGVAPLTVNFTNVSTGAYSNVEWDFGDGSQSTEINPSHQYTSDGVYQAVLTIYDNNNENAQYSTPITIYPDDDYSTGATTQQALFATKRFNTGQVSVRKTLLDGSTVETELPLIDGAGTFNNAVSGVSMGVYHISSSSDYALDLDSTAPENAVFFDAITAGKDAYIGFFMETGGTAFHPSSSSTGHQMFIYKITGSSTDTLYTDRRVVNISGCTDYFSSFWFVDSGNTFDGGSNIKTLQGAPAMDSLGGFNYFDTYGPNSRAQGTYNYFTVSSGIGHTQLFIQPTYSGWNSIERWKAGSVRLSLPFVLWHDAVDPGISLVDSTTTYRDPDNNLEYTQLTIENVGTVVGRAFHEKKMIVIDDQELIACLSYTSNRNYSLPEPVVTTTSTADSNEGFTSGVTYFITYAIKDAIYDEYDSSILESFGTGRINPLHCMYWQTLTPTVSGNKMRIQAPVSNWWTDSRLTSNDTGWTATSFPIVIIGSATTTNISDVETWTHQPIGVSDITELHSGLEISYPSTNIPLISVSPWSGNSDMAFGDDPIIIGHFSATSQSTIYKMSATCVAKNNEFNATQNGTFSESINESVYISEVALYNENNELLMTGKLNTPIEKNDKKFVTIKMELDL